MLLKRFKGGYDRNFCYIIVDGNKNAVIIDPFDGSEISEFIDYEELNVQYIISTHSHHDHVEGNVGMKEKTGAKIILHESTTYDADRKVKDDDKIQSGRLNIKFIHTPGHIQDGMCILIDEKLFTGDLLFVGKVGGTGPKFPGSDAKQEWDSLHKIMKLPGETKIYPGHDYGITPDSTIQKEKETNPFLTCGSFEKFVWIKDNWQEYKKENNIF